MKTQRVFIAVNLPEQVKEEVYAALSKNIPQEKCRVVAKENLHITMKFLGYLGEEKISWVKSKMAGIKTGPFRAFLGGVGHFNSRLIWLGARQGGKELEEINRQLNELLDLENESFHPHITLARNKSMERKEVRELVSRLDEKEYSAGIDVDKIDMMLSKLSPGGSSYSKIFSAPLTR